MPRRAILTFAPVFKDISNVVRYIKNGKAPRSDSKPTRVLKQKMKMTLRCLHRIFLIHEHWGNVRLQRCLYHYELSEEKISQLTIAIMEYFFPNITRNFFCFDSYKMHSFKHSKNYNAALHPTTGKETPPLDNCLLKEGWRKSFSVLYLLTSNNI